MGENRVMTPLPWRQVGLAVLPGLFALSMGGGLVGWAPRAQTGKLITMAGLMPVCAGLAALGMAGFVRTRRVPVWSLAGLGILIALGLMFATALFSPSNIAGFLWPALIWVLVASFLADRDAPCPAWLLLGLMLLAAGATALVAACAAAGTDWPAALPYWLAGELWWVGMLLVPIAVGLPLARHHGLGAGLLVVGVSFWLVEFTGPEGYGIVLHTTNRAAHLALTLCPAAALLVVSPAWLLRARSARAQIGALLLPALIGAGGIIVLREAALRATGAPGPGWSGAAHTLEIGLALTLTGVLYLRPEGKSRGS